ncbi:hypothetical protein [Actinoplanes sp. URMC 104]|uniref:hypothetical protein n=1 Tax=Actinoplanes sp. URMC 104 TaxID=3423409 RepID=UPI003F1E3D86
MSAVVDVGDAFTLTFTAAPGATVHLDWLDPDLAPVLDQQVVPASPDGSDQFPVTLSGDRPGMWTARFFTDGNTDDYHVRVVSTVGQPPPLAAVGDVGKLYPNMTVDEQSLTKYLLRAASKMLRQRQPNVDTLLASGRLDADVVALAAANMVLRVLRNPNGLKAETTGPFSKTYDVSAAAGQLVVTADDLANVTPGPAAPAASSGWAPAATIRVTPGMVPPANWRGGWRG